MIKQKKRLSRFPTVLAALILITAFLLFDSNTRLEPAEYEIRSKNIPAPFDGFRIVQLSDVHAAQFGKDNEWLISTVRAEKPDIIAVTGDLIDARGQLEIVDTLVSALTAIAPVFYVTGNHEWDSGNLRELFTLLENRGVTILRNDYVRLSAGNSTIVLAGVDDPNGPADMTTPEQLIGRVRASAGGTFIVLLSHRNGFIHRYASLGIDLVLSGHAHGGLVRFPFTDGLIGPSREWFPTYTSGIYTEGRTRMVVSRGIGNHTGCPRFLNNPHIPVVVLRSA